VQFGYEPLPSEQLCPGAQLFAFAVQKQVPLQKDAAQLVGHTGVCAAWPLQYAA
jgi:hypothetical protein